MNSQLNTEVTGMWDSSTIGAPRRDMIDEPWQDEPVVPYHVLLQNEIEALRDEVKNLRSQLLFPNSEPKFLGFPIRQYNASDDDCCRTTYEAYILGEWHEVVTCGLRWDKKEAFDSLVKILKGKAGL
jgi:hypothetical protein